MGALKAEITIPPEIIAAIAQEVAAMLKPILLRLVESPKTPEELMGVAELADYLGGVSKDWIYQRTGRNEIPFLKVGHLVKFRRSDIDRWLSSRSVPAVTPLTAPLPSRRTRDCESDDGGKTSRNAG